MAVIDLFTETINERNTSLWKAAASENRCRLAFSVGILPDNGYQLFMAQQIPPALLVKILRKAAEEIEANDTHKIILKNG